jgi:hypothetical protein
MNAQHAVSFVSDLQESKEQLIHSLRSFGSALTHPDAMERAKSILSIVLEQADRLRLDRSFVADACQVTEGTISRWRSGQIQPHPIIARTAIKAVRELALEKAVEYEAQLQKELLA